MGFCIMYFTTFTDLYYLSNVSPFFFLKEAFEDLYPPLPINRAHVDLGTLMRISSRPKRLFKTTNAYFYWVTREQGSFDWFKGVMNEVAELDQRVHFTHHARSFKLKNKI